MALSVSFPKDNPNPGTCLDHQPQVLQGRSREGTTARATNSTSQQFAGSNSSLFITSRAELFRRWFNKVTSSPPPWPEIKSVSRFLPQKSTVLHNSCQIFLPKRTILLTPSSKASSRPFPRRQSSKQFNYKTFQSPGLIRWREMEKSRIGGGASLKE